MLLLDDLSAVCPFCGGREINRFAPLAANAPGWTISVIECQQCEVAWQWPASQPPPPSVTKPYYDGYSNDEAGRIRGELELRFMGQFAPQPGKLIDVGAGTGSFIKVAAANGWEATGVDPSATPFAEGRAQLLRGTLNDVFHSGELFDAVTMFDVIEHVPDYLTLMQEAARLVKPGGVFVIETGNYQSLNRLRGGRTWWDYQTDHCWYLAPGIVNRQLREFGFQQITLCDRILRQHWTGRGDSARSWLQTVRAVVRRPWKGAETINAHRIERTCASKWPEWHQMGIFAFAAIKPAVAS